MSGNIANPNAYINYCRHGIDYVRCSIGSGSRCTTSANVSISYGNATLLDEINNIRINIRHNISDYKQNSSPIFTETKIIADGGIGWFDDIQKSLALGADYVMIGKLFAECDEACGPYYYAINEEAFNEGIYFDKDEMFNKNIETPGIINMFHKYRTYYGMSTKKSQSITGGDGSKTSEGISKPVEVKHSVSKFLDNAESYLRSCMTYTNSKSLDDLKLAEVVILGGSGDLTYRK
jgi:IMP dehydrogenase/GMP reductase